MTGITELLAFGDELGQGSSQLELDHTEESLRHLVSDRRYHKSAQSAAKFLGAIGTAGRNPTYRRDAQELRKERTALLSSS